MSKTAKQSKPLAPTSNYVSHYDPAKSHHRAWLQAVLDRLVAARCQLRRRARCLTIFVTRLIVTFALAPLPC
jgi:hypothetical protein